MARLKKNKKGYLVKTFTYSGKKYFVYGKTQNELIEKQAEKLRELEAGTEKHHNPTLNDYYEYFTELRSKEVKPATIRAQKYQFNNISEIIMPDLKHFGEYHMQDINRRDIETARKIFLESGKTPENTNICFAHLNHVFESATIDETILKNPCKALKRIKRESETINLNKHRALTESETISFFKNAQKRNSYYINIFKIMLLSGMRIGEVGALYLTDIDTKTGFIHVRRSVTRSDAGAYKIGEEPKTENGKRDIPLTKELLEVIKAQKELNNIIFGLGWNGLLFKGVEADILKEYSVNREIKRICKDAGIEKFTCHAFRNTFATRFIEQRPQDYKILSEILGHKDISITLNLYTHVMTENKTKAMNNIKILAI